MSSVVVFPEVQLLGSDFFLLLLSYVLLDSVAIYSDSTYEIATSPDVHAPVALAQFRKFFPQPLGTFALENLHHMRRGQLWGYEKLHVDVIRANSPLYDCYVEPIAQLNKNFFEPWLYLFNENVVPVFRYPYEMVLATVDRM